MASPLSIFRKYQHIFLVVFGVMLMVAFVIAPPVLDYLGTSARNGASANQVIVKWNGGEFREAQLASLDRMHRVAVAYLFAVCEKTQQLDGNPRGVRRNQFGQIVDPGIPGLLSEEELVHTYLLAQKGEEMGIVVTDEAVLDFLRELSDGRIPRPELGKIFADRFGEQFSEDQLIDQLRTELLAQRVRSMSEAGLFVPPYGTVLPVQAWDYYQRLNRRATVEVAKLPVESFESQVTGQPSEDQLKALFDEGRDRFPSPDSPEPGFKRRRKAAFQYVRADLGKFVEEEKSKIIDQISDAEIEAYYEENKDRLYKADEPASFDDPRDDPGGQTPAGEAPEPPADDQDPAPKPPAPGDEAPKPPAPGSAADDDAPKQENDTPAESSADEPNAARPPAPPESGTGETGSAARTAAGGQFFVSTQAAVDAQPSSDAQPPAEPDQPPVDQPPADQPPTDQPAADNPPAGSDSPPATANPAAATKGDDPPGAPKAAPDSTPADPAGDAPPAGETQPGDGGDEPPATAPAYRPLDDELRGEIRNELAEVQARKPAQDRLDAAMAEIRTAVNTHAFKQRQKSSLDDPQAKLAPIDVDQLAGKHGLTSGRIPLVDSLQIREYELGQAYQISNFVQRDYFHDIAFTPDLQPYDAREISGAEADVYFLFWKTDGSEPKVPAFAEARDEVVAAWKRNEARLLAQKEAEKLKEQAIKSKQTLEELLAGQEIQVVKPGQFSWMSTGLTPASMGAPELTKVPGVPQAGPEFMKTVFALGPGEIGVAMNQPQTEVYLVRMIDDQPSEDILKAMFVAGGVTPEVGYVAYLESMNVLRDWYDNLESEMGVKWMREPRVRNS